MIELPHEPLVCVRVIGPTAFDGAMPGAVINIPLNLYNLDAALEAGVIEIVENPLLEEINDEH